MRLVCSLMLALGMVTTAAAAGGQVPWAIEGVENSRYEQSNIGSTLADVLREDTGTDIALFPAGDIAGGIPGRELTSEDIAAVFSEDRVIAVTELTAPELKDILEISCSHAAIDGKQYLDKGASAWDGFLQISGCAYVYDVTAPAGDRVLRIQVDGADIDMDDTSLRYTAAASGELLSGQYGYPRMESSSTGRRYTDTLKSALSSGALTRPEDERIRVAGARDDSIVEHVGRVPLAAVMILGIGIVIAGHRARHRAEDSY